MENSDPINNIDDRHNFLRRFPWNKSALNPEQKEELEILILEYCDIFAKHRFDVGYNTELKIKLTPEHSMPMYVQGPPTPVHLREELQVELALMQYYGLITTLPQSKYSSPLFAHRKESGKLRLLIDLRRINHLLKNDYLNSNFPISNITDATNHFAGKTLFTKLDCSQAYHCVQMADDLSTQLLAFNFSSRTYAYKCLAQGLNKSVTGFSSFIRHYLDPCLAADVCTQFMDDIGCAVSNFQELLPTLRKIFDCIRRSGLKLAPEKCEIACKSMKFLGNIINSSGISPEAAKISKFLNTIKMPQTTKQVKRLIGFVQFFKNYIPNLGEKLIPFYQLLKKDAKIQPSEKHYERLEIIKKDLLEATDMTLRLPRPDHQYILLCDASYYAAGFVLMVEDYVQGKQPKERKTYAPVSFGSQTFTTAQLKFSIYYKEFLALYFALEHFAHYIWGASQPIVVLTDNKSLTQFFQSKTIPPSLWNFLDRVLSFKIVIAHIPGRANYAADFLSRIETDRSASLTLKMNDKITIREFEIDTKADTPDVTLNAIDTIDEIFTPKNQQTEFEEQLKLHGLYESYLERQASQPADEIKGFVRFHIHQINALQFTNPADTLNDILQKTDPLDLKHEQMQDDEVRRVIEWKMNGSLVDVTYGTKVLKKYYKQLNRLIVKEGILYRLFYNDVGQVQYEQYCLPKHLWKEVLYRLHNSRTAGHNGINRIIQEFRQRFYFPGFTEQLLDLVKNCLTCLQLRKANEKHLRPSLQPLSSLQSYPGDMLQIDLVGTFNSPVYKYVLSGIDVFSKFLFAVPLTNASADTVARELVKIFFNHSYIPETILSDLGTTFTSSLLHELTELLEIKLKHATLKHPQTIGVVERSHAALKRILKINTNSQWNDWHKYVSLAVFIHNTSYHHSIGYCPSSIFHGRDPIKPLDIRFSRKAMESVETNSDYVNGLQDSMITKFAENKLRLIESYQRYRYYYDKKAEAKPLQYHSYCLLLNPKITSQQQTITKTVQVWLPLYRVEKVLTDSNYIIRKTGTHFTQCVHRIRLRPIKRPDNLDDLATIDPAEFKADPSRRDTKKEPELFDEYLENLAFNDVSTNNHPPEPPSAKNPVKVSLTIPIAPAAAPRAEHPAPEIRQQPIVEHPPTPENETPPQSPPPITRTIVLDDQNDDATNEPDHLALGYEKQKLERPQNVVYGPSPLKPTKIPKKIQFSNQVARRQYTTTDRKTPTRRATAIDGQALEVLNTGETLTRSEKRKIIQKSVQKAKSSEGTSREVKLDQVRASILKYQGDVETEPSPTSEIRKKTRNNKQTTINSFTPKNWEKIFYVKGNILRMPYPIAHSISADFHMGKGFARRVSRQYPGIKQIAEKSPQLPIGAVMSYYEPRKDKIIFNLITKKHFFEKPTYYALSQTLHNLKYLLLKHQIDTIIFPKIGCGLDQLKEKTVFHLIRDTFRTQK